MGAFDNQYPVFLTGKRAGAVRSQHLLLLAIVLAVAAVIVGAIASQSSGGEQPRPRVVPPIYFDVYGHPDELGQIKAAREFLISVCMARQGFTYNAVTIDDIKTATAPQPFGLESLEPPEDKQPLPTHAPEQLTEAYQTALHGDGAQITAAGTQLKVNWPAVGCRADAEKRLLGDGRPRWMELTVKLYEAEVAAIERLDSDAPFKAVNDSWRRCMQDAGFIADDPLQLLDQLSLDDNPAPKMRADLTCKQKTDYLTVGYLRLATMQKAELQADPSLLPDWISLLRKQTETAEHVLACLRTNELNPACPAG